MNLVSREKAIDVAIDEYNRGYKEGFEAGKASVSGGSDLISRQAAIDICRKYNGYGSIWSCILSDIQFLPSAEPELIRCKDCAKREYCRTSTVWAVAPGDDWYCADADMRGENE